MKKGITRKILKPVKQAKRNKLEHDAKRHWYLISDYGKIPFDNLHGTKRKMAILEKIAKDSENKYVPGSNYNTEGGFSHKDKDIQWLLKKKYISVTRTIGHSWFHKKPIRYSRLLVTSEGLRWLNK